MIGIVKSPIINVFPKTTYIQIIAKYIEILVVNTLKTVNPVCDS